MSEDFEKQLTELAEVNIETIIEESKATSIMEFAKDKLSVAKVNRVNDAKGLLTYLYMENELINGLNLDDRLEKYGLVKVFDCFYGRYKEITKIDNDDYLWERNIVKCLNKYLPLVD